MLAGSSALLVPLAGCVGEVLSSRSRLDLVLRNYTADRQPLQVEVFRADGSGDGSVLLEGEFEVLPPADGDTAGTLRRPDVVPARRLLVRVRLKFGRGTWNHHHHVPDSGGPEEIDIRVYRDEDTGALYSQFF